MKNSKITENEDKTLKTDSLSVDNDNTPKDGAIVEERKNLPFVRKKIKVRHLDKGSFLSLLVRSFISFTIIIALAVSLAFVLSYVSVMETHSAISSTSIANYDGYLKEGRYNAIPLTSVLGDDGWFDVVRVSTTSDKVTLVYSTRNSPDNYLLGELDYIQYAGMKEDMSVSTFKSNSGENNYLITKMVIDESGQSIEQYILLDSSYKVISGTISSTKTQYTEREFRFMTYNASQSTTTLYKWSFRGNDGFDYYAICMDARVESNAATYLFIVILSLAIVVVCVIVIWQYVRYLNKHVVKPLSTLSNAMSEFANDGFREQIEYKGSTEFEQLCDSFNDMVSLLNATDEQKQLLEEDKRRMLAGLSHDLKTPITIIQGFAKAMRDGLVSKDEAEKYLQLIILKSEHMSDLINEFYEYTKLDHPDFSLTLEECDVAELAREFLAGIYDEFDINGYNLEANICDEELIGDVDKKQLTRVFENLATNFFKYTKKGSTLYFAIDKEDEKIKIVIADNGSGISDEARDDIFKPFVVGEKSRNKQGTGLGLAVCEKIVTAHGGEITLAKECMPEYNTQFEILLNLKK